MCKTWVMSAMLVLGAGVGRLWAAEDPNLVGWWTFDEGSGTVAQDASGNGHTGTVLGGAEWVEGKVGTGALNFDGVDDMVEVAASPAFDLDNALTLAAWIKPNGFGTYGFIVAKQPSGTAPDNYSGNYEFVMTPGGVLEFGYQHLSGGFWCSPGVGPTVGRWTHVAVTFQKLGEIKFYIDGVLVGRLPSRGHSLAPNHEPVRIGGRKDGYSFVNGCSDDVRIYNRALTDAEVKQITAKAYDPMPADGAVGIVTPLLLQWAPGAFAVSHNVYVGTTPQLTQAHLVASHQTSTSVVYSKGLTPGATCYWRVDEIDAVGAVQTGDVWSFVVQALTAYYPHPADGAFDVAPTTVLTWQPGQLTKKDHLYFSKNMDAVTRGTPGADQGEPHDLMFTPAVLDTLTTYYWRVEETTTTGMLQMGPVWHFTTCLPVDDFESYTDDVGHRIFDTWIDGHTNKLSGSTVGNTTAPFAEQTIVHEGLQAMPFDYNNVSPPFRSEAQRDFDSPQDWTVSGAAALILYVRGRVGNAPSRLYVAVEDASKHVAIMDYFDKAITTNTTWTQWKIPLRSFVGVDLAKVKTLYLGVGDRTTQVAGGVGRLYVDDIELTKW